MFSFWLWCRDRIPESVRRFRPSFNFIIFHYCYIIVWSLIGGVIIYGNGHNIAFIDALFFASGSATQSGLNTIDVNKTELYQQVTMMLMACLCNPIFINGSLVFIRLYWFEKRFQHVVLEARSRSAQRTLSRRKSDATMEMTRNHGQEEMGVGSPEIQVVRTANGHAKDVTISDDQALQNGSDGTPAGKLSSSEGDPTPSDRPTTPINQVSSNVAWADNFSSPLQHEQQVPEESAESPMERLPQMDQEKSIAFVVSQRNQAEKTKLRIPGPRDFDRGEVPEKIGENDTQLESPMDRMSHDFPGRDRSNSVPNAPNGDGRPFKNHITIDVPDRPRPTTGVSVYNRGTRADADAAAVPASPGAAARLRSTSRSRTLASFLSRNKDEDEDPMPYLSWTATIARNSNFVDLTEEQREELGGIEYRALKCLAMVVVCYFVGFHLLGMVCLLPWIVQDARFRAVPEGDNVNPKWWGVFTPASMFNDLGFTLTPDSMVSFQLAVFPLLLGTFLIVIGNTGFPCMLRFVIWLASKFVPKNSGVWEELRFLLDHPRRCFTLLFPSKANWWLFWVLILLNGIDLIFFIILDLNDSTVTSLPGGFRFLNGLFQAVSTRTAGFAVVNIANLHPAIQVSYLIMMYISVFPIAMSMRQTNVYEEKSLGVWADEDEDANSSYLSHHLRRQLSFDLWFLFLGFFLVAIIEGPRIANVNDYAFNLFSVLFEIVSAYGTVGLSLGYPNSNASFSAQFRTLSKLIMIAMQIRGRHRGLPYALDRAVLLPSESLHLKENEDATRRARRGSHATDIDPAGLARTSTGMSRPSSVSGEQGRYTVRDRFRPKQIKRIISGAISNGPAVPHHHEKRA